MKQSPLTYAIGDVHGRLDLLEEALRLIDRHSGGAPRRLVLLGDYIDRGPHSAQVVERLMALTGAGEAVCLKGNHEAMMLEAAAAGRGPELSRWLANGGLRTLQSYEQTDPSRLPGAHLRWLAALPLSTADPHRIYVHAGLMPGTPFDRQREATLLWIREAFLKAPAKALPRHVVHGHTPVWAGKPEPAAPELLAHRTNLDTGAYATGVLSVGVFDPDRPGGPVQVFAARGPAEA